jgi:hypothetical protein
VITSPALINPSCIRLIESTVYYPTSVFESVTLATATGPATRESLKGCYAKTSIR